MDNEAFQLVQIFTQPDLSNPLFLLMIRITGQEEFAAVSTHRA